MNTTQTQTGLMAMLLLILTFAASAQPSPPSSPRLSCIASERLACGCSIRLTGQTCPNQAFAGQPHLFSELEADAPLWLVIDGQEQHLPHTHHIGSANKGDNPGRFSDIYANPEFMVRIDYTPAASTCPKDKLDRCEYTDVHASILLQWPDGRTQQLEGRGTCGC